MLPTVPQKKLYLVDASGYIFRAYYAIRPLSNSKGLPTNALFGFTSMLMKLLREQKPDLVGIVFDVARKTFRNEMYPAYKANRAEPPADLVPQFPYFRKIVKAMNLPVLELPNYEADDVIGTIAKKYEKKKISIVIVTGDKDMMQLVDENVLIYDSMKEKWIGIPEVKEKFGVIPKLVPDILALAGDSSDNIPGVPGIGDKTAIKLIQEHGSLENVLKNAAKISGKLGEKLTEFADQARLCRKLATIVTEAPLEFDLKDFEMRDPDPEAAKAIFEELGFKRLLSERAFGGSDSFRPPKRNERSGSGVQMGVSGGERDLPLIKIANYLLDPDKRSLPIEDFEELKKRLEAEGLMRVFLEIELPLVPVLKKMEENGVKIDAPRLEATSEEYGQRLKEIEKKVHQMVGMEFNLNSPKQLSHILFEKMNMPVIRRTKTGYSTDVEVLTELAKTFDVPKLLLEHRSLSKLKSTYLDALPQLVNSTTGRIHTSFNQTVAATGRLSSSDPNLQNIPIRTEEGKKIREAFIAEKGFRLVSADYSQIELRILAHLSQDPIFLKAFDEEKDVHRTTAAAIFGIHEGFVTSEMRSIGKTVNFAVLYGQGAYSLSQQLEISVAEADRYIRNYFQQHQGVTAYKEKIMSEVRRLKLVRTLFGRLRRFPEIDSPNNNIRAAAERTAFNTVFQGTAADLIKKAMIQIQDRIEKEFQKSRMLIQVHDELVFEVPEKETEIFSAMVRNEMESAAKLDVSLKVDVGTGTNWAEAH